MKDASRYRVATWKNIIAVLYIIALLIGIYEIVVMRLAHASIMTNANDQLDVHTGIRRAGVETTPEGTSYIWVGSGYVVDMIQPQGAGIVAATVWIHPSVLHAEVKYGGRRVTLPVAQGQAPRQLNLLVDTAKIDGRTQFTITASEYDVGRQDAYLPIAWAFSKLQWISIGDRVHGIWVLMLWSIVILGFGCIAATGDWWQGVRWVVWGVVSGGIAGMMPLDYAYWWVVVVLGIGVVVLRYGWSAMRSVIWAVTLGIMWMIWHETTSSEWTFQRIGVGIAFVLTWMLLQSTITRDSVRVLWQYHSRRIFQNIGGNIDYAVHRYVSFATAAVAIVTMTIAIFRTEMSELWDRVIFVGAVGASLSVIVVWLIHMWRATDRETQWSDPSLCTRICAWGVVVVVVVFWWFTFQQENLSFTYLGFPWYVFVVSFIGAWGVHKLLLNDIPRPLQILRQLVAAVILTGGIFTAFVPVNLVHNMYVINEILVPISDLVNYDTFIPQYTTLYSFVIKLLVYFDVIHNPDIIIDLIYIMLQLLVIVAVYLAVRINYKNMVVPRWSTALIFSIPPILFAKSPWWEVNINKSFYYSMNMYNYSLVSNRSLVVFAVGTIAIWVISRIQLKTTIHAQLVAVYGLAVLAMLGAYHNSDFGTFAAIGAGVAIVCYPFLTIQRRIIFASVYGAGIVVNYLLFLQGLTWLGMAVNADYLFWFQRQFASGFGAFPIRFPGNGLFIIGTAVVTATTGVWISVLMRDRVVMYQHDTKLTHMYVSVVYFGVTTVLGLTYYLNRSNMSFHGSSAYITLFVGVFALYNLILYMQNDEERGVGVNTHNFVMRFLVAVPLSIALTHAYIPREFTRFKYGSAMTKTAYGEVMTTIKEYRDEIEAAGFSVAYGGDFGHVVELYVGIPAVSLFNSVQDTKMSPAAEKEYCDTLLSHRRYDVIIVSGMVASLNLINEMCDGMVVLYSEQTQLNLFVRRELIAQYPDRWNQLQIIMSR